jgi:hypothetical protein
MKKFLFLGLSVAAASSHALLIDTTGGTNFYGDDLVFARPLGASFQFYGVQHVSANVSTNGNLQFLTNTDAPGNVAFPATSVNMIAPFWDDLYVLNDSTNFLRHNSTAQYDAFTWDTRFFGTNDRIKMQAVLVHSNVNLGGASVSAGDIAFSYDAPVGLGSGGTVGLNEGTVSGGLGRHVYAPGHTNNNSTVGMLPDHLASGQFYLFTKGPNGYTPGLVVPEPGTFIAIGIGIAGLALVRPRK